jgi:selenocysteine-specific elongation factor
MIVGTAGHIDHGKSTLVRALTGVGLKEEKARGISIELGYAYQPLENGEVLGFIDVPGHERFIHTMLAGAAGIDFALLVVAADDGVMPQTREHLEILNLPGIERGAVAITKIDQVEAEQVAQAEAEIRALLARTPLSRMPIFAVSTTCGTGIDTLRTHLHQQAMNFSTRASGSAFRLAVDRSFSLHGAGTVVTATVFAGQVRPADELMVSPGGRRVSVRGLHTQNRRAELGGAGQRCALNLAGVDKDDIQRGDWIVAPHLHAPSERFDARLHLSSAAPHALKHWTPVHLHLGASHLMARIALLESATLAPGDSALVQVVTDRPLAALHGDGFILRDAAARHTLGGGQALDPWGPPRRRNTPARLAELAALEADSPTQRLSALLHAAPWGIDIERLEIAWNHLDLGACLPGDAHMVIAGRRWLAFSATDWQVLETRLVEEIAACHEHFPDELAPDGVRARRMAFSPLPSPVFTKLLLGLQEQGRLQRSGPWYLPQHRVGLSAAELALYQRIRPWLLDTPYDPPWVRDLAKRAGEDEGRIRQLLLKLGRLGLVFQVVRDLFYAAPALADLARIAGELDNQAGEINAAQFRDLTPIGRKRCIQILEFFDRVGYTRRVRDTHRLRPEALADMFETGEKYETTI